MFPSGRRKRASNVSRAVAGFSTKAAIRRDKVSSSGAAKHRNLAPISSSGVLPTIAQSSDLLESRSHRNQQLPDRGPNVQTSTPFGLTRTQLLSYLIPFDNNGHAGRLTFNNRLISIAVWLVAGYRKGAQYTAVNHDGDDHNAVDRIRISVDVMFRCNARAD